MGLQSTFCECLVYILLGQVLRYLVLKEPEKKAYITLVTKVVMQITLPCLLLRNLSSIREISEEGWILIAGVIGHTLLTAAVVYPLFHRMDLEVRSAMYCTSLSFNVGLFFYPIIEDIAGTKGVTTVAMEEIPADVVSFVVYVFIYDWGNKQRAAKREKEKGIELEKISKKNDEEEKSHKIDVEEVEIDNEQVTIVTVEDSSAGKGEGKSDLSKEGLTSLGKWEKFKKSKYYPIVHAGSSIIKSMPVMAILLGLILGVGFKVSLPTFLDNMLEKVSRSNTFMSMLLLGLLLNLQFKALKENIVNALKVVLLRYVLGAVVGLLLYFFVGNSVSATCKFIFAVGFFLPTPIVSGTYAFDKGYDPTLPVLIVNLTMIVSFFLIWAITAIIDPDLKEDSSMLLSSSSSSSSSSSLSSSLFNSTI